MGGAGGRRPARSPRGRSGAGWRRCAAAGERERAPSGGGWRRWPRACCCAGGWLVAGPLAGVAVRRGRAVRGLARARGAPRATEGPARGVRARGRPGARRRARGRALGPRRARAAAATGGLRERRRRRARAPPRPPSTPARPPRSCSSDSRPRPRPRLGHPRRRDPPPARRRRRPRRRSSAASPSASRPPDERRPTPAPPPPRPASPPGSSRPCPPAPPSSPSSAHPATLRSLLESPLTTTLLVTSVVLQAAAVLAVRRIARVRRVSAAPAPPGGGRRRSGAAATAERLHRSLRAPPARARAAIARRPRRAGWRARRRSLPSALARAHRRRPPWLRRISPLASTPPGAPLGLGGRRRDGVEVRGGGRRWSPRARRRGARARAARGRRPARRAGVRVRRPRPPPAPDRAATPAEAFALELADVAELLRVAVDAGPDADARAGRGRAAASGAARRGAARRRRAGRARGAAGGGARARSPRGRRVAGVHTLVAALARAERHGSPLGPALAALAEEARAERTRRVRDRAARAAPKIQLVVALLLVPAVLLMVAASLAASLLWTCRRDATAIQSRHEGPRRVRRGPRDDLEHYFTPMTSLPLAVSPSRLPPATSVVSWSTAFLTWATFGSLVAPEASIRLADGGEVQEDLRLEPVAELAGGVLERLRRPRATRPARAPPRAPCRSPRR